MLADYTTAPFANGGRDWTRTSDLCDVNVRSNQLSHATGTRDYNMIPVESQ